MKMLNKILMLYAFPSFLFFIFTSPGVKDLESKKRAKSAQTEVPYLPQVMLLLKCLVSSLTF